MPGPACLLDCTFEDGLVDTHYSTKVLRVQCGEFPVETARENLCIGPVGRCQVLQVRWGLCW
eukprot:862524-Prymnesium_polylepis.1